MPRIVVLPHEALCPQGAEFDAKSGISLSNALPRSGIKISIGWESDQNFRTRMLCFCKA